jgi:hypothetical protein
MISAPINRAADITGAIQINGEVLVEISDGRHTTLDRVKAEKSSGQASEFCLRQTA